MALKKNLVLVITYQCRDIGYGIEEGTLVGFWTGEVDSWGKLTILPLEDPDLPLYLFLDEILSVEDR